jgi:hypothetical protein
LPVPLPARIFRLLFPFFLFLTAAGNRMIQMFFFLFFYVG